MKYVLACFFIGSIMLAGCSKNGKVEGTTRLDIRLTDNPFNADEVNVDIEKVRVKLSDDDQANNNNSSDDNGNWVDLETAAGIYNLLDYQNGLDTVVASGMVPATPVKEIRFVLGTDNSIVINGQSFPLTIPSGSESGLKIKLDKNLNLSVEQVVVDFDAELSVHQNGTGNYILRPVLRIKE